MPKSKSKRNKYIPPPKPKPKPSPRWLPVVFFACLALGFISIMSRYILSAPIPLFDSDWFLWGGLGMMALALAAATQWR